MPCENPFDTITKALAGGGSRRQVLKWLGAGTFGTLFMTLTRGEAEAASCTAGHACTPFTCPEGKGCFCSQMTKNATPTGRSWCWQDQFCNDSPSCTNNFACIKFFRAFNYRCVETCCGTGHCFPKCGTVPPISLGVQDGATGAGM